MKELSYTIKDPAGLHARPVGAIVKLAKESSSKITLSHNGKTVDAKKLFAIMGLAVNSGETIQMTFDGSDEETACSAMKEVLEQNA